MGLQRVCRQSRATWREHHRFIHPVRRVVRKATGAPQGSFFPDSRASPSSGPRRKPSNARAFRSMEPVARALWAYSFNIWMYAAPTISRPRSGPQPRGVPMRSPGAGGIPFSISQRQQVVDLAARARLPAILPHAGRRCRCRGPDVPMDRTFADLFLARRYVRGYNSRRREARRSPRGAAEPVRWG